MDNLKMAEMMVVLYQLFKPEAVWWSSFVCDCEVLHRAVTSGVITYTEYSRLLAYAYGDV